MVEVPFEGGAWIQTVRGSDAEKEKATGALLRCASRCDADTTATATVLQALGLIPYRGGTVESSRRKRVRSGRA